MRSRVSHKQGQTQKGFTLLETTIALVVMMVGGLGIAAVFAYAVKNNTGARDRAAAIAVAQQELERLRNVPFTDPALAATVGTPTPATVYSGNRSYTLRTTITDTTTSVKTIQIQVTPASGSTTWALGTVNLIATRSSFALGPHSGGP